MTAPIAPPLDALFTLVMELQSPRWIKTSLPVKAVLGGVLQSRRVESRDTLSTSATGPTGETKGGSMPTPVGTPCKLAGTLPGPVTVRVGMMACELVEAPAVITSGTKPGELTVPSPRYWQSPLGPQLPAAITITTPRLAALRVI